MKTIQDLRTMTNEELIQMANEAEGHTKDFQEYMQAEFSYSTLTKEITNRGGQNGWFFPTTRMNTDFLSGETVRKTISLDKQVADELDKFASKNCISVKLIASFALKHLMDGTKNGTIQFDILP